jgi:hypothetical protein
MKEKVVRALAVLALMVIGVLLGISAAFTLGRVLQPIPLPPPLPAKKPIAFNAQACLTAGTRSMHLGIAFKEHEECKR